ncbi:MAG: hypothetical protein ABSF33_09225 [Acidimicrobiales bacterium]|jgi:hypothetical protein
METPFLYDGRMAYQRPNISDVGLEVGKCLSEGDEPGALRLAFRCVELVERAPVDERQGLVAPEPVATGDARYDALLAAIAEYLCAREGLLAPDWVEDPSRFLDQWWFVSGIQSLHADAIAHSPIAFARRGVFITAGALAYA